MKQRIRWFFILILTLMTIVSQAQNPATTAFILQMDADGMPQLGEVELPGASLFIDWNPQQNDSRARVNDFGQLLFAPINTPEGVYTFSPYFEGYSTASLEDNRLRVDEVKWSPDGQQMVFRVNAGHEMGNDGVWYWQPAQETSTDPSYHLLRDCPPGCGLANSRDTEEWKSLEMDWSPDNVTILVHMNLPDEDRNALGLVFASRDDESPQADLQPTTYRYEYGAWAADGEQLVVSGLNPDGVVVFGTMNSDGNNVQVSQASSIDLAYVRNAVEDPTTGDILMLGSPKNEFAAVAIYDANGTALTEPIGSVAPDHVEWSPNHDAVLIRAGNQTFIATVSGAIYDITLTVANNPMVNWVEAGFPTDTTSLTLPEPTSMLAQPTPIQITMAAGTPAPDDDTNTTFVPQTTFEPGQLLQVAVEEMTIYAEPVIGSETIATLTQGEALVLIGGPLSDGRTIWWRIQTLDHLGWIEESIDGESQISS